MAPKVLPTEKLADHPDVFISYRRQEASYLAAWMHETLSHRFGQASIFLDIDCIRPGIDYLEEIEQTLGRCSVLIVVVGHHWLKDPTGRRRIDEPDDPIRWEIELALSRSLNVIPVLLDGAVMPTAAELPPSISRMARINAIQLRRDGASADMRSLLDAVQYHLTATGLADADRGPPVPISDAAQWPDHSVSSDVKQNEGQLQDQRFRLLSQLEQVFRERVEQAIEGDAGSRLTVALRLCPAMTFRASDQFLGVPDHRDRDLQIGTDLLDVFDHSRGLMGDGLLVLGGPGSGKTTLLFEMAASLVTRAQEDASHPIPVYLALQSWAERRQVLSEWVVAEMSKLYQVPAVLVRRWMENGDIMLLLDGLDEISSPVARRQCAEELNRFNRFGRPIRVPTIVASRTAEYDEAGLAMQLETAVELRPLDPSTILEELSRAEGSARILADTVRDHPNLLDLLSSPLLITMLRLSLIPDDPQSLSKAPLPGSLDRAHLVDSYLDRRLLLERQRSRERRNAYSPEMTRRHLQLLAKELTHAGQTEFLPDRIRRDLIVSRFAQRLMILVPPVLWTLVLGICVDISIQLAARWNISQPNNPIVTLAVYCSMGLIAGLSSEQRAFRRYVMWLGFGMARALIDALSQPVLPSTPVILVEGFFLALYFGLLGELAVRLICRELPLVGSISFSWAAARRYAPRACLVGILFAVLVQVPNWLSNGWPLGQAVLLGVLFGVILGLFFGISLGFGRGVQVAPIPVRIHPNAEVRTSTRIGLLIGLLTACVGGAIFFVSGLVAGIEIGITRVVVWAPAAGVLWALASGLGAVVQYWVFRFLLWCYGLAPLRLLRWLEYAVHLRLLYRAGGGYVFIHKTVQDAFAQQPAAGSEGS